MNEQSTQFSHWNEGSRIGEGLHRHMVVYDAYALAPFRMLAAALTMLSMEGMTSFQSLVFSPQSGLACTW